MSLLTLEDVRCTRGGVAVLDGVSFAIDAGEAVVLRGPNGSGKTTLLRTIAGLQPAEAGHIDTAQDAIAYGAHADGLKAPLTVAENLNFWARLFGTKDIQSALETFDLVDLRDRRAGALSAGQKRRVGLARVMVTERPIWALDEPTVSLDAASVGLFSRAIKAHLAAGGAAVIATHIDLGIEAREVDVTTFKPTDQPTAAFDEAFL